MKTKALALVALACAVLALSPASAQSRRPAGEDPSYAREAQPAPADRNEAEPSALLVGALQVAADPRQSLAEEKALERRQIAFGESCELVALDNAPPPHPDKARASRETPRVKYSGDFDPAQIPGVRALIATRADVVGYIKAPEPKAVALHPRGIVAIFSGATSQRRAEIDALKHCNDDRSAGEGDQNCFVYAIGAKVVLPMRATKSVSRP